MTFVQEQINTVVFNRLAIARESSLYPKFVKKMKEKKEIAIIMCQFENCGSFV